jgi:threonine dehydratase
MESLAISPADVEAAARRLRGVAHRTPVMTSRTADAITGAELFFKSLEEVVTRLTRCVMRRRLTDSRID